MKTPRPYPVKRLATAFAFVALAAAAVCARGAGLVYESANEFFSSGDFNGDGITDVLVVDKATGNARVGLADTNGNIAWQTSIVTGVQNASGCAVEHFQVTNRDSLALTEASLNQVILTDVAPSNRLASQTIQQPGLGPHALAGLASPLTLPLPTSLSYILIASSFNDSPAERLDLAHAGSPPVFSGQFPEPNTFERINPVMIGANLPTLAAGLVRSTNDTLHLWQFSNSPPIVLSISNLPPGSDYTVGAFAGDTLPRFSIYQSGTSNLSIIPLITSGANYAFGAPLTVPLDEAIQRVYYLPSTVGGGVLVQFIDGVQVVTLSNNTVVLSTKYQTGANAGDVFTGVAPLGNGQFALLDAPPESGLSVHSQVINFDGVHFTPRSTSNLSALSSSTNRANVWLFQLEPFVNRSANFIASFASPAWADSVSVSGLPTSVKVLKEIDSGVTNGLGNLTTNALGVAPTGVNFGIGNQYNPAISIFSYTAPQAAVAISVTISPAPGYYGSPLAIALASSTLGTTIHYRVNSNAWNTYSASFMVTNDSLVQYYGTTSGGHSPLLSANYFLGHPSQSSAPPAPVQTIPGNTNTPPVVSTNTLVFSDVGTIFYGRRSGNAVGSIWAIGLDGSADTYITMGVRPRVSHDGKWLAFLRDGAPFSSQGNLWLRNLQTGVEQRLLANLNYIHGYDWLNDNSGLVLDYQCGIYSISTNGLLSPLLSADCNDGAPTPNPMDGSLLFHNLSPNGNAGIYVANANGSGRQRIEAAVTGASWPAWSTDGLSIVFADSNNTNVNSGRDLWVTSYDGSEIAQISGLTTAGDGFPHGAIWTPENSGLIAAGNIFGTNGLWLIPLTLDRDSCAAFPVRLPTLPGDAIDFAGSVVVQPSGNVIIGQKPGLFIRQTADAVIVYWNTNFTGFTLESRGDLANSTWTPVVGPYFLNGIYFEHWESRSSLSTSKFFRLHYTGAVVVSASPMLNISVQNSTAMLSWSSNLVGFVLQSKDQFSPAVPWTDLLSGYLTNGNSILYNEPINSSPIKFYRLRSP